MNHKIPPIPADLSEAEKLTWQLDGPDGSDRVFRHDIFSHLPPKTALAIAKTYQKFYIAKSRQAANLYLLDIKQKLTPKTINIAISPDGAELYAKSIVRKCLLHKGMVSDPVKLYKKLSAIAEAENIKAPLISSKVSLDGALRRLADEQWWRSKLRKYHREQFEIGMIRAGLVHKKAAIYVSDESLRSYITMRERNNRILESLVAFNEEDNSEHILSDLAGHSQSNPDNRRAELMVRLHGTDQISQDLGHKSLFITLTCPSRMHPRYASSGDPNPNYDCSSPSDANSYLNTLWSRIRATFKRRDIHIYGIRVAEPQHDGTPHWHILLFASVPNIDEIKAVFIEYALHDSPDEKGAKKHRVTFEDIDPEKGTATGYIAKYITKNIDGKHIDTDIHGNDAKSSSQRVAAWASIFHIRQFQFFGTAPVGLWREIRRLKGVPDGLISVAFAAADKGDWKAFILILGGIEQLKKLLPIKTLKTWVDSPGKYGEPIGDVVLGVTDGVNDAITRSLSWKIQKRKVNEACSAGMHGGSHAS